MFRTNVIAGVLNLILLSGPLLGDQPVTVDVPIARPLAVAYSPSDEQVAVGGLETIGNVPIDGVVQLIDTATGARQSLLRHSGTIKHESGSSSSQNMIHSLAYSPDGSTLAVASDLGLKLWDPANGQELATLLGYGIDDKNRQVKVTSVAFSPDGKLLAVARSPIEIWDVKSRKPLREIEVPGDTDVTFSNDGTLLVSASYQNHVRLWSIADGKEGGDVHAEMGPLYGVAIDQKGERVAAVGEGGEKLWRIEQDAAGQWRFNDETRLTGHVMSPVRYVAFSPAGRLLATAGDNGALVAYDPQTRQLIATLLAGGPFAFSPDGKSLAVAQLLIEKLPGGARQGGTRLFIWRTADVLDVERMAEQARTAAMDMVQTLTTLRPDRRMMQGVMAVLSGPQGNAATPILVDALKSPPVNEKQLLIFALVRIADRDAKARAAIIEALQTAEAVDVRTAAAGMLAQLSAEAGKEAVPALVEAALNDENPQVRSAAGRTLQKFDPQAFQQTAEQIRARGPIVDRVEKSNGKLVYQGRSLEEWIKRLSVSYIPNEIFGRPRPDEPLAAIRAIGPNAVPVLVETLKNGEWPERQAAAAGLEALGPQAAPAVDSLMDIIATATFKDLGVAGGAADAVAAILKDQKKPPTPLVELTNSDDPAVRLSAARAVAQIEPIHPRGLAVLKAALAASSTNERLPHMRMTMGPFPEQPPVGWLEKIIADDEAPVTERIRAAETLARMKEGALPALPEMIKASAAKDVNLSHQTTLAIQKIGPQAVPAVSDALKAEMNARTRQRLAAMLWGMGDEGRHALKGLLQGDDAETLWWAAAYGAGDLNLAMSFEMAVREALEKSGQPVASRQPLQGINAPGAGFPKFEKPTVAWSVKILADGDAPQSMRMQAASTLIRAPQGELLPLLPVLLSAMGKEEDRTMISQLANAIQRVGPEGIPSVKSAIEQAQSDYARRELLRALSSLGKEGQQEFARLMQNNSVYSQLFSDSKSSKNKSQDRTREPSSLEQNALQEAERTSRLLTNGDFTKGLEGWNIEGGAAAFRTFPRGDASFLTTWGDQQDGNTGRLFQCFKVPNDAVKLVFKLHGGSNREKTYVALWRKNDRQGQVAARNDNTPFQASFLLKPLRDETVTLEIVDNNTDGWGFIGVEDFHIVRETELNRLKAERECSTFDVYLRGKKGQEIKGQVDTGSDSFVISSWSDPSKSTWTPQAGELPLTLDAFTADGQTYDVPDDWNGKISGWAFLLPAERDLLTVQWNEGAPTEFWQGASFGWGGLRNRPGKVVTGKGSSDETKRFRYVPMAGNSTSDISFDTVRITPVPSQKPLKPLAEAEE